MRRIYDSEALRRDDDDPFVPNDTSSDGGRGHVNWGNVSHAFTPQALRSRAISVSIETDRKRYARDDPVGFRATFSNRLPMPITIVTESPKRWNWSIDGRQEATVDPDELPRDRTRFRFARGERKQFSRRWHQRVRESDRTWRRAAAGEHTLAVAIAAVKGADRLSARTTFEITSQ